MLEIVSYYEKKKKFLKMLLPSMKPVLNSIHVLITSFLLYQYVYDNQYGMSLYNKLFTKPEVVTSVWCNGNNLGERQCRFENLCYIHKEKEFVFLRNEESTVNGMPEDRFNPSFVDLSSVENHNMQHFQYTDLPASVTNDMNVVFIDKPTLLFNRFYPGNLMHIFHDDLLPLFVTRKRIGRKDLNILYLDGKPGGQYSNLYDLLLGPNQDAIENYNSSSLYCFRDAWVGVNRETTWYQYGFHGPQGPLEKNFTDGVKSINEFRKHMLFLLDIPINDSMISSRTAVLLTRKKNRLILNEAYMILTISRIIKRRVQTVNLEKYAVKDIIRHIHDSGMVIGMHGSLMVLSMFLPPGSVVVELFPYAIDPDQYTPYKTLANLPGLQLGYKAWNNSFVAKTVTHPNNTPELGGISHLPQKKQDKIKKSVSVPPHKCCYNPEWLYRIYQDTTVELKTFGNVMEEAFQERNRMTENLANYDPSVYKLLYPAKVGNVSCFSRKPYLLRISWTAPWNLAYLNSTDVDYEVWIQQKNSEDIKAYVLRQLTYEFELNPASEQLVWVRCLRDNLKGPFNDALKCKVK